MSKLLRKFVYRFIYAQSPGWKITRWLNVKNVCEKCSSANRLDVHHIKYPFFDIWYALLPVVLLVWYFWSGGLWLFVAMLVIPDFISPLKTLCRRCHELEERRKNG